MPVTTGLRQVPETQTGFEEAQIKSLDLTQGLGVVSAEAPWRACESAGAKTAPWEPSFSPVQVHLDKALSFHRELEATLRLTTWAPHFENRFCKLSQRSTCRVEEGVTTALLLVTAFATQ